MKESPTQEDLRQWLTEKQYLIDTCRPVEVKHGQVWLMDGALTKEQEAAFLSILDRPPAGSVIYKFGSRSFVGDCPVADTRLALKYYYPLSLRRQLGYTLLGTRCMRSWISSRALQFIGVRTPPPVAVAELTRYGGIAHRSLMATQICEGTPLVNFLETHSEDEDRMKVVAQGCRDIFSTLAKYRIYHRDANTRNFIIEPDLRVSVVDLDAVSLLVSPKIWPSKRKKDVLKFSKTIERYPNLHPIFEGVFD